MKFFHCKILLKFSVENNSSFFSHTMFSVLSNTYRVKTFVRYSREIETGNGIDRWNRQVTSYKAEIGERHKDRIGEFKFRLTVELKYSRKKCSIPSLSVFLFLNATSIYWTVFLYPTADTESHNCFHLLVLLSCVFPANHSWETETSFLSEHRPPMGLFHLSLPRHTSHVDYRCSIVLMALSLSSQTTYLWSLKENRSKKAIILTLISVSQDF